MGGNYANKQAILGRYAAGYPGWRGAAGVYRVGGAGGIVMTPEYLAEYRRLARDETGLQERDLWRNTAILKLVDEVERLKAELDDLRTRLDNLGEFRPDLGEVWQ